MATNTSQQRTRLDATKCPRRLAAYAKLRVNGVQHIRHKTANPTTRIKYRKFSVLFMKWIVALFVLGALSGCIDDDPVLATNSEVLSNGAYKIFAANPPTWSMDNGTATVLLMDLQHTRIGSLFLDNETVVSPEMDGNTEFLAIIESNFAVTLDSIQQAIRLPMQYHVETLAVEDDQLNQITEPLIGYVPLQNNPVSGAFNTTLPFAPLLARTSILGVFTDAEVEVQTPRGIFYQAKDEGSAPIGPEFGNDHVLRGDVFSSAIDGRTIDIQYSAGHLDGVLAIEFIGFGPAANVGNLQPIDADIAFKFGQLQFPSRVDLHQDAEFLYLQSESHANTLVYDPTGNFTLYQYNGTLAIPAEFESYVLVPYGGSVSVGSDVIPRDFELRKLPTEITRFVPQNDGQERFHVEERTITVPGTPYTVLPHWQFNDRSPLGGCDAGGYIHLTSLDGNQTYAAFSETFGADGNGIFLWETNEAQLVSGTPRNSCENRGFEIHSFQA